MAEPFYVVLDFPAAVFQKGIGGVVDVAGKHQILPYDQALFIAQLVEIVGGVVAAAPDADAVEMSFLCTFQKIILPFFCDPGVYAVFRNIIGSHGENPDTVYLKSKFFSPLIPTSADGQCPQADGFPYIPDNCPVGIQQLDKHIIQILFAVSVGPPQLRVGDGQSCLPGGIVSQNGFCRW